uniref:Flagellar biosynthetic protein FliR n=1 Tax=mine drainage metagenome TaxID=410659 RepID=E6QR66_9ZZZZ
MITFTAATLYTWLGAFLWPLTRILGLISTAPVFGHNSVPVMAKIGLGVLLAIIVAPNLTHLPDVNPASLPGILILIQQFIIGTAMGFAMNITFIAVDMAGSIISMTMGLSFASFFDPQAQGQTTVISQFLTLLATLVFLSINGHLVLIKNLIDSFYTLPIGMWPGNHIFLQMVDWSGIIMHAGVQLSLPIIAALLITNIALGILTRAAPQLNLFGIGFPITIGVGFLTLALTLPYLAMPVQKVLQQGLEFTQQIVQQ